MSLRSSLCKKYATFLNSTFLFQALTTATAAPPPGCPGRVWTGAGESRSVTRCRVRRKCLENTNIFQTSEACAISHADTILDCFHEGRHSLPGLPRDVKVNTNILLTDISILFKQEDVADLSSNWINPIYCRNLSVSIYPRILLRIFPRRTSLHLAFKCSDSR